MAEEFYATAERLDLEGIVSKKASAPYRSGRTETWLKVKCFEESIYEVAAVLREPGRPNVAYMVTPDKERRYVASALRWEVRGAARKGPVCATTRHRNLRGGMTEVGRKRSVRLCCRQEHSGRSIQWVMGAGAAAGEPPLHMPSTSALYS